MRALKGLIVGACAYAALVGGASAQILDQKAISLGEAKKIVAAAAEEAKKNNWTMAIAVVDMAGTLIYFERIDETQVASAQIAIDKAVSAARFKRPTKVFEDAVAGGRNALLGLRGAVPIEGGVPIMAGGKVIGAVGASGGTAPQDGQVASAGAAVSK
jgi:glc operon protein GlcG